MNRRHSGFTLIELMIVLAIIAVVASIAIPSLIAARSNANDKAIVATMRSIITAQELARMHALIDTDNDGSGEGASLPELAGGASVRGTSSALRPPYISQAMGTADIDGHVLSHGFYFAMYLPNNTGTGVVAAEQNLGNIDANLSETFWSCVAWPSNRAAQGYATYFINQAGDILRSKEATYSGKGNVPPAGCALRGVAPTMINSNALAIGAIGADGFTWITVN